MLRYEIHWYVCYLVYHIVSGVTYAAVTSVLLLFEPSQELFERVKPYFGKRRYDSQLISPNTFGRVDNNKVLHFTACLPYSFFPDQDPKKNSSTWTLSSTNSLAHTRFSFCQKSTELLTRTSTWLLRATWRRESAGTSRK